MTISSDANVEISVGFINFTARLFKIKLKKYLKGTQNTSIFSRCTFMTIVQ